jgi:hypothetical protein
MNQLSLCEERRQPEDHHQSAICQRLRALQRNDTPMKTAKEIVGGSFDLSKRMIERSMKPDYFDPRGTPPGSRRGASESPRADQGLPHCRRRQLLRGFVTSAGPRSLGIVSTARAVPLSFSESRS